MKHHHPIGTLVGKRVAFLLTDGFEQVEFTRPRAAAEAGGATVEVVSLAPGEIYGMHNDEKGDRFAVDRTVEDAIADDYDALVLPGGLVSPDTLRASPDAVGFARTFFEQHKPVAAICHGPWLLIEADVVRDRTLTSWPSLQTDIQNAGGCWVNEACHCDRGLVTSRCPEDLDAFCAKLIVAIVAGRYPRRSA